MHRQAVGVGPFADAVDVLLGIDPAAAHVCRVFQADEGCPGEVLVVGTNLPGEVADIENPAIALDQPTGNAGEGRGGPLFVVGDVAGRFDEQFIAQLAVNADAHLVGLGTRRGVDSGLFAEHLANHRFEAVDRGVFPEHVVADLGLGHGPAHAGGGTGRRIASQVDFVLHSHSSASSKCTGRPIIGRDHLEHTRPDQRCVRNC